LTVHALTRFAGVSQPAVSKHLSLLRRAKLVRHRREGRETHYRPRPQALEPMSDWLRDYGAFWRDRFDRLGTLLENGAMTGKDGITTQTAEGTRSVVIERGFPHPPEKLWRALTDSSLIAQWLLKNDFEPEVGRAFQFLNEPVPNWDGVIDCKVLVLDPLKRISYTWRALGLDSVVLFTLTPTDGGTRVRMEHSGFRTDQEAAYKGANYGWQKFLGNLEKILEGGAA
jgi:uncharacterized protein YndB with AHSA1/START domain